jgi:tripartite-type tricarboxylate transporter receptor subunit TctC
VPTTVEAGVPCSDYNFWIGMMVPSKTPRTTLARLHQETEKALATPEVRKRYSDLGAEATPLKPEEFDAVIKSEIATNRQIVEAAGLKAN